MQNASIDLQAAAAQGVVVSGTSGPRTTNTAELTWALILALVRHLPEEAASVRDGGWQHTVGTDLLGALSAWQAWAASATRWPASARRSGWT